MPETYIARSTAIAARMLGGEMMIMSALDSTFFTLNEVATVIWQAADGNTPLSAIVETRVCGEFEIEPETARRDAEQFVAVGGHEALGPRREGALHLGFLEDSA